MNKSTILLWFDTEFTHENLEIASFMQVAIAATDIHLKPITPKLNNNKMKLLMLNLLNYFLEDKLKKIY